MKKYISMKNYKELWENMQGNMRFVSPPWSGIGYQLKHMCVSNQSGPGTKYANELERMKDEYFNPTMPRFITMHTRDGIEYIYPEKK